MLNNPFHAVTVQNRTNKAVEFQIQPDHGPIPAPTPLMLPNGSFQIPMIQPQDDSRHIALGRFMDQWSKLEMQIARLLGLAMSTNNDEMPVVMNALGSRGQRECLETLLLPRLEAEAAQKLSAFLVSFKHNATKRNYLAHGYWHLEVIIADRNGVPWANYRQFRRYNPSNAAVRKALDERRDPKSRKAYMFSVARINAISSELERLWHELSTIEAGNLKDRKHQSVNLIIADGVAAAGVGPQPITHDPANSGGKNRLG